LELNPSDMCRTRIAEATDWIAKYFNEASKNGFGMWKLFLIINVQNASVPASNATQMTTHEDLTRHTRDVTKTVEITMGIILILPILEILDCKFRNMQNLQPLYPFWRRKVWVNLKF
jgi:hypothetical protein